MSAIHGKNTFVQITDAANAPQVVSSYLKEAVANRSSETAESSAFGTSAKTYVVGMNDETVDIQGHFDVSFHNMIIALMAAIDSGAQPYTTVTVGPAGNATGMPKTVRNCIFKSYSYTANLSGVVTAQIQLQRTGPNTDSVF